MNILLINSRHLTGSTPSFLHGLLQLCAEARDARGRAGWEVDPRDTRTFKRRAADFAKTLLLGTVFLRIRFNVRGLFVEPALIGAVQAAAARLRGRR